MSEDLKNWGFGKIKHQICIKDEFSSRKETNPEDGLQLDNKVKRAVSTHFPKHFRSRNSFQKKVNQGDSYFKDGFYEEQ